MADARPKFVAIETPMLKVGLTGGIASGKSTVGAMFVALGAHLIQADEIAHQLMLPGQAVYEEVVRHFGREILEADGRINRSRLAEAAFGDPNGNSPSRVEELNHIVHPAVLRKQEEWMRMIGRGYPQAVAIVEAALILEAGAARQFDRLMVVTCEPEQRISRWSLRRKVDLEAARLEVTRRMAAQLPDARKVKAADYVIDNSGSLPETEKQVQAVFTQLQMAAKESQGA
ncbi:MAG TPA: dephospho-CoA kinase [Terriglobales bacterium]|nr:dephospho-CoA kinase [Terriglobales bacterium]